MQPLRGTVYSTHIVCVHPVYGSCMLPLKGSWGQHSSIGSCEGCRVPQGAAHSSPGELQFRGAVHNLQRGCRRCTLEEQPADPQKGYALKGLQMLHRASQNACMNYALQGLWGLCTSSQRDHIEQQRTVGVSQYPMGYKGCRAAL